MKMSYMLFNPVLHGDVRWVKDKLICFLAQNPLACIAKRS